MSGWFLRTTPGGLACAAALAVVGAAAAQTTAREAFRVPGRDLVPEGIAYDPVTQAFYLGSIHRASIVRVDRDGRARELVAPRAGGMFSVLGLRVDPRRRLLWACSAAGREFKQVDARAFGQSGLFAFDPATGELKRKAMLAGNAREPHLLNDVVATHGGDVYATDTTAGRVWVLRTARDALEPFVSGLRYPNGIALAADERSLYVAHADGISRVDLASRATRSVGTPNGVSVAGIDGLYVFEHSLVGVQNGTPPERVVRLFLDGRGDAVTRAAVLLEGDRRFSAPTTAAIADGRLYLLANSLLDRLGEDGSLPPPDRLEDPLVLEIELSSPRGGSGR